MKINWKVRFKNKTWVATFLLAIVAFGYQMLGMVGVTAPISEDQVTQILGIVVNLLVAVGVITDPTTSGLSDSDRAMGYKEPR